MTKNLNCEIVKGSVSEFDLKFKVIIIGDSGVGKSCLLVKALQNKFSEQYNSTIGFEFYSYDLKIDNQFIRIQLWDTCGEETYRSLVTNFYRGANSAILVYSIADKNSFSNIEHWLNELKTKSNPDIKIILIGNKNDLEESREISKDTGEQFYKDNNFDLFLETSAKTGHNTDKLILEIGKILYLEEKKNSKNAKNTKSQENIKVELGKDEEERKIRGCIC